MPSDLQLMYDEARRGDVVRGRQTAVGAALSGAGVRKPRRHHAALRHMARKTGIDPETLDRCLKRARRADAIETKRAKKPAKATA